MQVRNPGFRSMVVLLDCFSALHFSATSRFESSQPVCSNATLPLRELCPHRLTGLWICRIMGQILGDREFFYIREEVDLPAAQPP
jgi:hypothetical protein